MTGPEQQQDDLTDTDHLVARTDNGLRPEDPPEDEQPPQDPGYLPEGTETGDGPAGLIGSGAPAGLPVEPA